jgi:hypothetical protein
MDLRAGALAARGLLAELEKLVSCLNGCRVLRYETLKEPKDMAKITDKHIQRGQKMKTGKGWRLISPGDSRRFKATLVTRFDAGDESIAIFKVLPYPTASHAKDQD